MGLYLYKGIGRCSKLISMNWNVEAYRQKVFQQLKLDLKEGVSVLDIGCGDGGDALFIHSAYKCPVMAADIVRNPNWRRASREGVRFVLADILDLPFGCQEFDVVFMKDVLHHTDGKTRDEPKLTQALQEIRRVAKRGGLIVIVEANRYNPVFYVHMTLLGGHNHFTRSMFHKFIRSFFGNAVFLSFEAHVYPTMNGLLLKLFRGIEALLERTPLIQVFLSYNAAVIRIDE